MRDVSVDWRIVCFEGLPGSGKSTAAQRLALDLHAAGVPARWYYEGVDRHPLPGFFDAARDGSPSAFMAATVQHWQAFAAAPPPGVHIIESHLLQGPVGSLLSAGCARSELLTFLEQLMEALRPRAPRLVLLRETDPAAAMVRMNRLRWGGLDQSPYVQRLSRSPFAQERGVHGTEALLRFYQEWSAISDAAIAAGGWPTLTLPGDSAAGIAYQHRRAQVNAFLGVPVPPPVAVSGMEACAGIYAWGDADDACFRIDRHGDVLVAIGCPHLWRTGNRLLPMGPRRCLVESWPLTALFPASAEGAISEMRLVDADDETRDVAGPYPRRG